MSGKCQQHEGNYLWVLNEAGGAGEAGGVTAADTSSMKVAARIQTGAGADEIAFEEGNMSAFVNDRADGRLPVSVQAPVRRVRPCSSA